MHDVNDHQDLAPYLSGQLELREVMGLPDALMDQFYARAQFFVSGGHWERALIMLERLEELDRKDLRPVLAAADVLVELGRSFEAEARLLRVLAAEPDHLDALACMVRVHLARADVHGAADMLRRIQSIDPQYVSPAARRALVAASAARAFFG